MKMKTHPGLKFPQKYPQETKFPFWRYYYAYSDEVHSISLKQELLSVNQASYSIDQETRQAGKTFLNYEAFKFLWSNSSAKIIKVGGKEFTMNVERWINRFEKIAKQQINSKRSEYRRLSLKQSQGRYYTPQPTLTTIPLWDDIEFLQWLQLCFKNAEKWVSNEDDTVRTIDPNTRWWGLEELDMQISFLSLYESADFHPSDVK